MNPLVKKEIRLLLPGWAISVLLALCTGLIPENPHYYPAFIIALSLAPFLLCPAMLMMTTLSSFGGEFNAGTFSLLLAQPVSRRRIWWTKTSLLAAAVLSIWLTWCISYSFQEPMQTAGWYSSREVWLPTALFGLAMYSGGLWTVLLFRQVAAAFWFTVLIPAALFMIALNFLPDTMSEQTILTTMTIVFGVYGLAGFGLARWLFFRAQDVHWLGGAFVMPEMPGRTWFKIGSGECRLWRPRAALLRKELQLHQSQFLMAGGLLLLHLGALATRKLGHFPKNSTEEVLLDTFWIFWLVMPLLTGCAAVADERKMGTLESQLCLPAKRRTQFAVKLFATLALAVGLGTLMPWLLEGHRILPDIQFNIGQILTEPSHSGYFGAMGIAWMTLWYILVSLSPWLPLFFMALLSAGIAALAFYASTLARNTLQALGLALLGLLVTWLLAAASLPGVINYLTGYRLWWSGLIYLIGVPVMVMVLAALAFWNFKRVLVGWTVWRRNLLSIALSLALVTLATTALYHRAWELLTPLEPPHGAARLTGPVNLRSRWNSLTVFLPNGSVWLNGYLRYAPNPFQEKIIPSPVYGGGTLFGGAHWVNLTFDLAGGFVGLQRDGTLWISEKPPVRTHWIGEKPAPLTRKLVQFGNDHDWQAIIGDGVSRLLLKKDGTLWHWGITEWDGKQKWPGLRAFEPHRLGTNSDWSDIFQADYSALLRKTDGSVWVLNPDSINLGGNRTEFEPGWFIEHQPELEGVRPGQMAKIQVWSQSILVGIKVDGTLSILAHEQWNRQTGTYGLKKTDIPVIGKGSWVALARLKHRIVTLERDGSLWLWDFYSDPFHGWNDTDQALHQLQSASPIRLGTHSDWIAIGNMMDGVVALAADGSLWLWRVDLDTGRLLQASRKPTSLGNIFDQTD
jgi:hypothetical protein